MFEKLRAIFGSSGGIVTRPQGDGRQITATEVLQSLISPSAASSLGTLLMDAANGGPLRYSPVVAAERFLSESIATLPLITYRRNGDDKERATDSITYDVLKTRPNDFQTAFIFWRSVIQSAIYKGNCYILIERNGLGEAGRLPFSIRSTSRSASQAGLNGSITSHHRCKAHWPTTMCCTSWATHMMAW